MPKIGLLPHAERPSAVQAAKATATWLEEQGHLAVVLPSPMVYQGQPGELAQLDLLVSLGGDGTILRSVGIVMGTGVPVLGVNFGAFGYLAAAEPDGLRAAVQRFLSGDYELARRMTIDVSVLPGTSRGDGTAGGTSRGETAGGSAGGGAGGARYCATGLNDVVLARPSGAHTISTNVAISGTRFLSYAADAMIVSTSTGSTGYNLSARGPIVSPKLRCLVVTPVSPHMLFDRTMVLDSSDEVSLRLEGRTPADLVVDGVTCGSLEVGEQLVCRAGAHDATLVTFGDRSFESVLKQKFHLADR